MTKHDYKLNAYYLIYLIRCVLHDTKPSKEKVDKINLSQLYEVAKAHTLTAITAYALESAGVYDKAFEEAKNRAIRKNIILDTERKAVFDKFDKAGIWYVPLKGIIIKDLYPQIGMREMADNDILIDRTRQEDIRDVMLSCGFRIKSYDESKHDIYFKEPLCNFQMHVSLFDENKKDSRYRYFKDVGERLVSDEKSKCGKQFTNEDFYLYIKSHEFKHYSTSGTGLRNIVDSYLLIKNYSDMLDWDYIYSALGTLEMTDYEKKSRNISKKLFEGIKLNDEEKQFLDYFIFSGTYGSLENSVSNKVVSKQGSKMKYLIDRVFLPMYVVKKTFPVFYKNPILLPFLPFYRLFRSFKKNRSMIMKEIKMLIKL